ncbi:MAG: hypothetical protein EZS28_052894, partial [Streblomastix strix]
MVSESPRQFKGNKPLQEATFIPNDSKVHFYNMDSDSIYLAIAGSNVEGSKQGLKYVIKGQELYDEHYKECLLWDGCTIAEEKKLMGISSEIQ